MTIETSVGQGQRENLSPLQVEKIEEIKKQNIEVNKEGKLVIDGVVQEKYSDVEIQKDSQKNNSDIISFRAFADLDKENYISYIIDVKNPEKELLTIKKDKDGKILVNDRAWNSLINKNVYFGGYRAEIDPEGKKVVFCEVGNEKQSVIVNNDEWQTKIDVIDFATSRFGTVYAVGGSTAHNKKLFVNDKEWFYTLDPKIKDDKDFKTSVRNAVIGKDGTVAATVTTWDHSDIEANILIGDKNGSKDTWKSKLHIVRDIIVNDENGSVAVFGKMLPQTNKQMCLIIDDVVYKIESNPKELECFKFENDKVVIQYIDALGEKVTEKISLREGAKEIQEQKEKKSSEDRALEDLRRMIAKENIPLEDIMKRLKNADGLEKANEKNKELESRINELSAEKTKLEMGIQNMKKSHGEEMKALDLKLTESEMVVIKLENILKGAEKVMLGSDRKLSADSVNLAMETIQDLRKNHNWTPGT